MTEVLQAPLRIFLFNGGLFVPIAFAFAKIQQISHLSSLLQKMFCNSCIKNKKLIKQKHVYGVKNNKKSMCYGVRNNKKVRVMALEIIFLIIFVAKIIIKTW